jgi:putative hydrolase of the HAD superfamily
LQLFFYAVPLNFNLTPMPVKAIIYDLDNTVFPVSAIGEKLFSPVFDLIKESGEHDDQMDAIKYAMMRTPFRIVAEHNNFSEELTNKCIAIQETLTYNEPIDTFEDYPETTNLETDRFLVTTGFRNMQTSKIKHLGIENDFDEVHVVNPVETNKKEVFADILTRYDYAPHEVLVVGDDPESEIKAAKELGITTVLYDKDGIADASQANFKITHFSELKGIIADLST